MTTTITTVDPTEEQADAIQAIKKWLTDRAIKKWLTDRQWDGEEGREFLLDGAAGTGKTTVAQLVTSSLGLKHVVFGAFTAKAARVMEGKGMKGASTLHSLLYKPQFDKDGRIIAWIRNEHSPCKDADLIVVDEVSMVNDSMADDLRRFGRPLLVLGDVDGQLPPISGTGAFNRRRPDFRLHEVHRTIADSPINQLAWRARRGVSLCSFGEAAHVAPLRADAWPHILNRDNQVICGRHTTRTTVIRRAREAFGFSSHLLPRPGEPLICRRNNYGQGLINGEIAILWRITEDDPDDAFFTAELLIDGQTRTDIQIAKAPFLAHRMPSRDATPPPYDRSAYFDWAYAITCHSAQGSEWPSVVVIDDQLNRWDKEQRRRWLYTAITRASEQVTVFTTG